MGVVGRGAQKVAGDQKASGTGVHSQGTAGKPWRRGRREKTTGPHPSPSPLLAPPAALQKQAYPAPAPPPPPQGPEG